MKGFSYYLEFCWKQDKEISSVIIEEAIGEGIAHHKAIAKYGGSTEKHNTKKAFDFLNSSLQCNPNSLRIVGPNHRKVLRLNNYIL